MKARPGSEAPASVRAMTKPEPVPVEFTAEIGGKTYRATYTVAKGCITVVCWFPGADRREMTTQLGGHATIPESLARRLLAEMVGATS